MGTEEYTKNAEQIHELATLPPSQYVDKMATSIKDLNDVAPSLAPHISATMTNGMNFLHSKMPKPLNEFVGDDKYEPSKGQKHQWMAYHQTVTDPVSTLEHVKNGTLTNQHVEALQAVHPELYKEMQQKVMEQMNPKSMKNLPYATKLAVAKFLQTPASTSMMPQVIAADQMTYNSLAPQAAAGTPKHKGGGKPSTAGLSKIDLAKRTQTQAEKDESDTK